MTTGKGLLVTTTSSKDEQTPLFEVHLKVVLVPAGTPVTVVLGSVGLTILPTPLTIDQTPGIILRSMSVTLTLSIKFPIELSPEAVERASN